jgi:ribosome maturation protein Sdo1
MFERPIKGDLDRSLSMLMHEARHKLTDECNQIKSDAIKAWALQSTRVIVTAATTADEQHQDAMKQAKPMLLDFIERMQLPPAGSSRMRGHKDGFHRLMAKVPVT